MFLLWLVRLFSVYSDIVSFRQRQAECNQSVSRGVWAVRRRAEHLGADDGLLPAQQTGAEWRLGTQSQVGSGTSRELLHCHHAWFTQCSVFGRPQKRLFSGSSYRSWYCATVPWLRTSEGICVFSEFLTIGMWRSVKKPRLRRENGCDVHGGIIIQYYAKWQQNTRSKIVKGW